MAAKISIPKANKKAAQLFEQLNIFYLEIIYGSCIGNGLPPSIEMVAILSQAPLP